MKTEIPPKKLVRVSLAASAMAIPIMPAEANNGARLTFQISEIQRNHQSASLCIGDLSQRTYKNKINYFG